MARTTCRQMDDKLCRRRLKPNKACASFVHCLAITVIRHMNKPTISRRSFLRNTTFASAFFIVPRHVLGKGFVAPSDKLNFGFIGCGKQSPHLMRVFLDTGMVEYVAAADVFAAKTERFVNNAKKYYRDKQNTDRDTVKPYTDFREMLQRSDIDAVVIATPDHWHAAAAVRACAAGKDVYCEKPLALTVEEGRAMVDATRKHNRVFQTGSMQRSAAEFRQAVELVRNGYIGEIKQVKVNIAGPPKPFDLQAEAMPDGLNWEMWLGPNTTDRPYNKQLAPDIAFEATFWPQWRAYKDFGGGSMTDWGAHMIDIAQWGLDMDASGPVKIIHPAPGTAVDQGLIFEYANGILLVHENKKESPACTFIGTTGEAYVTRGAIKTKPDERLAKKVIGDNENRVYMSNNHYEDFIDAIKKRSKPICDVETGHRTGTVCNIGNIAYELQRSLTWNAAKETFEGDKQANNMLGRKMKKEWEV